MVAVVMASSPCRAASSSQDFNECTATTTIPDCMPGTPTRWFFSLRELRENCPSLKVGIDLEKELYYRQQAASFIHELGSKLQLSHLVMNVAMIYMHRFYVFHNFRRFPRNDVAAACIFLAAKVEEMPRKLEYIVKVSYALQHRDDPSMDVKSNRYNEEAQKVVTYENILLQTLGFDLTVAVPNQFVVKCIQMVKAPKELAQAAYHFTNDCLHLTTLCLRYRPSVVACASIFLACSWAKWEIPLSHDGKPWYYYVDNEVTKEILEALAEEIVSVYQKCPDRLKIKRYMATKREDSAGAGGASTSEGGIAEETTELFSANSLLSNARIPGQSTVPSAKLKADLDSIESQQKSMELLSKQTTNDNSEKKQKAETAKVDLRAYMDRMKERKPEQQVKPTSDTSTVPAPARKSFMPDVSSTSKELEEKRREERHQHRTGHHQDPHRQSFSRHEHKNLPKTEQGRHHHADISTTDNTSKKRHHEETNEADEVARKMAKTTADSLAKHLNVSGKTGGDKKVVVGEHSGSGRNGSQCDEGREKTVKKQESDAPSHSLSSSAQKRPDEKGENRSSSSVGLSGMLNDDTLREAAQLQLLKRQKLERLKNLDVKAAAAKGGVSNNESRDGGTRRDPSSSSSGDPRPPLPPSSPPPPLPPLPPPPPPPPPS